MKAIVGYSIVTHYDDKSTETTKIPGDRLILQVGKHTYLNSDACPIHGPWKAMPGGTSKSTGRAYNAFWTCDVPQGAPRCVNKPSREWEETHPPAIAEDFSDLQF
jgi:hypothetical protein